MTSRVEYERALTQTYAYLRDLGLPEGDAGRVAWDVTTKSVGIRPELEEDYQARKIESAPGSVDPWQAIKASSLTMEQATANALYNTGQMSAPFSDSPEDQATHALHWFTRNADSAADDCMCGEHRSHESHITGSAPAPAPGWVTSGQATRDPFATYPEQPMPITPSQLPDVERIVAEATRGLWELAEQANKAAKSSHENVRDLQQEVVAAKDSAADAITKTLGALRTSDSAHGLADRAHRRLDGHRSRADKQEQGIESVRESTVRAHRLIDDVANRVEHLIENVGVTAAQRSYVIERYLVELHANLYGTQEAPVLPWSE